MNHAHVWALGLLLFPGRWSRQRETGRKGGTGMGAETRHYPNGLPSVPSAMIEAYYHSPRVRLAHGGFPGVPLAMVSDEYRADMGRRETMSITNGWLDWAIRVDGIPDKVWSPNRAKKYLVNHSIEGNLGAMLVPPRFLSVELDASGAYSANAQASVHFVLHKDGRLVQMYPLQASPWTSGSKSANEAGVAIETEGVAGELLNAAQVDTYVHLVIELTPWFGFELSRAAGTIKEHRELAQTACPSGRYQSAYDALARLPAPAPTNQEDEVTQAEYDTLNEAIRKRLALITFAADLSKYPEMLELYALAKQRNYVA